jgi:hypothetical protein
MEKKLIRKANKKELRLRKLAQTTLEAVERLLENQRYERSESYIAFNCKVDGYITIDDVKSILRCSKMTFQQIRKALTEFNEKRIENLYCHVVESEANFFKDWVAGCSFMHKKYVDENIERYLVEFPNIDARKNLNRLKSVESKKKFIYQFFKEDFEALDKLALIEDVFQIGRSGGHFAVANASIFEEYAYRIRYFLENCFFDSEHILLDGSDSTCHRTWHERVRGYFDCSHDDIESISKHCEAVEFVMNEGTLIAQGLNRQFFLDKLRDEIRDEVGYFDSLTDDEILHAWLRHEGYFLTDASTYTYLRLSKDQKHVETSQGVKISLDESKSLYLKLATLDPSIANRLEGRVASFHTNAFGSLPGYPEPVLVAGCHKIKWSFIKKFYEESLLPLAA